MINILRDLKPTDYKESGFYCALMCKKACNGWKILYISNYQLNLTNDTLYF